VTFSPDIRGSALGAASAKPESLGEENVKLELCRTTALALTVLGGVLPAAPALAQNSQVSEIIVTARKRQESILNVPVVETALPQQRLERLQVKDMKDIASLVPGLAFGDSFLSIGTQVSLRGVGTISYDPGVDQSITLVLDGLQLANGLAYFSGAFDMGQVEVLKGPQALFYGKASPGGVISIRSADPTSTPEIIARAGYEFEAREKRGELIVSGPIVDTLKGRLAFMYTDQDGFFRNPQRGPLSNFGGKVASDRLPAAKNWMIRGTLLWNPTDQFDARLKVNNVHDEQIEQGAVKLVNCPDGIAFPIPFIWSGDTCHLDRNIPWVDLDPAAVPGILNNGVGFIETTQTYGTLELNYRPTRDLTVTSDTGVYLLHSHSLFNPTTSDAGNAIAPENGFRRREVTQELRVNSDFAGPLNFTAGAFFERGRVSDLVTVLGNTKVGFPPFLQQGVNILHIKTESVFGQLRYQVVPQLELAAGARWTDEKRTDTPYLYFALGAPPSSLGYQVKPNPEIESKNISPEFTITYRPSDDITVFGSWKKAYKSGSYSIGTPPLAGVDNSFGDEKVQGGELGLKSRLLDRTLLFNLSGYVYKYSGLQVGAIIPTENGIPVTKTVNAGGARVRGVEAEVSYRPPQVPDLSLHADLAYNNTKYTRLDHVPCYGGQTIAAGCNEDFNPTNNGGIGGFSGQDRSGLPLIRGAKLQANFGLDWETSVGRDMRLLITNNNHYSSKYLTDFGIPWYQKPFIKADLSVTLQGPNDRWEVAVIGKNLNNALTTGNCVNSNLQAASLPGTVITGTNLRGPAGIDEVGCLIDRGREVWLRLSFKPLR
jgi:iron complex outermembrane receptor protein